MIIDINDTLVLDDNNEYIVASKTNYENKTYYYLLDKNDNINFAFCYEENNKLVEVNDNKLVANLLPLFIDAAKDKTGN